MSGDLGRQPVRRSSGADLDQCSYRAIGRSDHHCTTGLAASEEGGQRLIGTDLSLSADQISDLRRRTEPGLTFTLRRILGKASDLRLALSP